MIIPKLRICKVLSIAIINSSGTKGEYLRNTDYFDCKPNILVTEFLGGDVVSLDTSMMCAGLALKQSIYNPFDLVSSKENFKILVLNLTVENFRDVLLYAGALSKLATYDELFVVRPKAVSNDMLSNFDIDICFDRDEKISKAEFEESLFENIVS